MFGGGIQIACLIWNDVKTLVCAVVYHGSDQKRRNESRGTQALATNHPILVTPGLSQTRPDTIGITINQANKDCLYKVQIPRGFRCPTNNRHIWTRIVWCPCILNWLRFCYFVRIKSITLWKVWEDESYTACLNAKLIILPKYKSFIIHSI